MASQRTTLPDSAEAASGRRRQTATFGRRATDPHPRDAQRIARTAPKGAVPFPALPKGFVPKSGTVPE